VAMPMPDATPVTTKVRERERSLLTMSGSFARFGVRRSNGYTRCRHRGSHCGASESEHLAGPYVFTISTWSCVSCAISLRSPRS
jgi:hypothetical protein